MNPCAGLLYILLRVASPMPAGTSLDLVPPFSELGTRIPPTRNPYLAEIFTGPRGGKYWITSGGRKHYTGRQSYRFRVTK